MRGKQLASGQKYVRHRKSVICMVYAWNIVPPAYRQTLTMFERANQVNWSDREQGVVRLNSDFPDRDVRDTCRFHSNITAPRLYQLIPALGSSAYVFCLLRSVFCIMFLHLVEFIN